MNTTSDCSNKPSECNKRSASPRQQEDSPLSKQPKVDEEDGESESRERAQKYVVRLKHKNGASESSGASELSEKITQNANGTENASETERKDRDGETLEGRTARSDCATIVAAEALASLTGCGDQGTETPCSSKQALGENTASKASRAELERTGRAADSCSVYALKRVGEEAQARARDADEEEEDDGDSLPGSSLTASSSDDDDDDEDDQEREECSIVSVQMAPELRRSVALLAQVQMRLDALEKKGARLHRRLELRLGRQRRPHLEQRAAIAQSIPGFWLTAVSFLQNAPPGLSF